MQVEEASFKEDTRVANIQQANSTDTSDDTIVAVANLQAQGIFHASGPQAMEPLNEIVQRACAKAEMERINAMESNGWPGVDMGFRQAIRAMERERLVVATGTRRKDPETPRIPNVYSTLLRFFVKVLFDGVSPKKSDGTTTTTTALTIKQRVELANQLILDPLKQLVAWAEKHTSSGMDKKATSILKSFCNSIDPNAYTPQGEEEKIAESAGKDDMVPDSPGFQGSGIDNVALSRAAPAVPAPLLKTVGNSTVPSGKKMQPSTTFRKPSPPAKKKNDLKYLNGTIEKTKTIRRLAATLKPDKNKKQRSVQAKKQAPSNKKESHGFDPNSLATITIHVTELDEDDVLMGRGGRTNAYTGNLKFHGYKRALQPKYHAARKSEKGGIVVELVGKVQSKGGRFLKQDEDNCDELFCLSFTEDYKQIHDKCTQALRENFSFKGKVVLLGLGYHNAKFHVGTRNLFEEYKRISFHASHDAKVQEIKRLVDSFGGRFVKYNEEKRKWMEVDKAHALDECANEFEPYLNASKRTVGRFLTTVVLKRKMAQRIQIPSSSCL